MAVCLEGEPGLREGRAVCVLHMAIPLACPLSHILMLLGQKEDGKYRLLIGHTVPSCPWQWLVSQWVSPSALSNYRSLSCELLMSAFSFYHRIVSYCIFFEVCALGPRHQISILYFEGFDPTCPGSLLTLQSVICATSDINIWLLASVKDVGIVIFIFILITSLEWVFATGDN